MRHGLFLLLLVASLFIQRSVYADPEKGGGAPAPPVVWDPGSATLVESINGSVPFVRFSGKMLPTQTITLNGSPVQAEGGRFQFGLALPEQSNDFEIIVKTPGSADTKYQFRYRWKVWPRDPALFAQKPAFPIGELVVIDAIPVSRSKFSLRRFDLSGLYMIDSLGGKLFSGSVGWAPEYRMARKWTVGLGVDFTMLKTTSQELFPIFQFRLSLAYSLFPWLDLEAGTGSHAWISSKAFLPILNGALLFKVEDEFPDFLFFKNINQILLGYTYVIHAAPLHLIRLGVRLEF